MGDEGCNICSQNSEFFQNSDMKGYIANIPFLGNVFVLTQAKMYLQYSEFLKKMWDFTQLLYIQKSSMYVPTLKICAIGGHLLQNSPILIQNLTTSIYMEL